MCVIKMGGAFFQKRMFSEWILYHSNCVSRKSYKSFIEHVNDVLTNDIS